VPMVAVVYKRVSLFAAWVVMTILSPVQAAVRPNDAGVFAGALAPGPVGALAPGSVGSLAPGSVGALNV